MHPDSPRATTFWRSLGHAWNGLVEAAATERNMRIHLVAGVLAGSFATLAPLDPGERALIVLCTALVIAAEALNTSLEALVDLHGGPPSEPARRAKDAAAGAVLALAAASVAIFAIVSAERWGPLLRGWRTVLASGLAAAGLAALAALLPRGVPRTPWRRGWVAGGGVILLTLLALGAPCPACALVPAVLLGVAFAAGSSRR